MNNTIAETAPIHFVFSDVDGTLVHYPDMTDVPEDGEKLVYLPQSSTGLRGFLSKETFQLCSSFMSVPNRRFALVSGMRTITLWKRIPFLPRAHAYATENGGRIFYSSFEKTRDYDIWGPFVSQFSQEEGDNKPFYLVEDLQWKQQQILPIAGSEGYEDDSHHDERTGTNSGGILWDFARKLSQTQGVVIDSKGYATNFRIHRKKQPEIFDSLLQSISDQLPTGLSTTTNLGSIDVYPNTSGKKNCCIYLANTFANDMGLDTTGASDGDKKAANDQDKSNDSQLLSRHAVCLCDDDNDLEMALACSHAYLPGITSDSLRKTTEEHPQHFTFHPTFQGVAATEWVLAQLLRSIQNREGATEQVGIEKTNE